MVKYTSMALTPLCWVLIFLLLFFSSAVQAGDADVVAVTAVKTGNNTFRFDVTVSHADEGWDHYADKWDIVGPDGTVFGTRILYHPHVAEQPFIRSLTGVKITEGVVAVSVRAHDSVHLYGGKVANVILPR
jgi:hypothetical protein